MLQELNVLIVDDEEDLAEIVAEALELKFKSASFVTNAHDALKKIEEESIDIVISDSNMPSMSGMELLEKISSMKKKILFYLATGDIGLNDSMVVEKGGNGVIEKPFSTKEIIARIEEDLS